MFRSLSLIRFYCDLLQKYLFRPKAIFHELDVARIFEIREELEKMCLKYNIKINEEVK